MDVYRHQSRGGKGRIGARTREEDFVEHLFIASAHSYENDEQREALLAELEMHFAAQRFEDAASAFEAVKTYALERAGGKH